MRMAHEVGQLDREDDWASHGRRTSKKEVNKYASYKQMIKYKSI